MTITKPSKYSLQEIANQMEVDASGNVAVGLTQRLAGEDLVNDVQKVEQRFMGVNLAAAATTVVKTGSGLLHAIVVNATSAGAITVYDNTAASGTKIATLKASIGENTYTYNCQFATGLTIVLAGASDVTVVYR